MVDTTDAGDSRITGFITSYIDNMKHVKFLMSEETEDFVKEQDRHDLEDCIVISSMCTGNLLARRNCLVEGSFGYGVRFETAEI